MLTTCFGAVGHPQVTKAQGSLYIVYKRRYWYMVWSSYEISLLYSMFI